MSKKMLKRSLALGALMAFVITGSAMAEELNITEDSNTGTSVLTVYKSTGDSAVASNNVINISGKVEVKNSSINVGHAEGETAVANDNAATISGSAVVNGPIYVGKAKYNGTVATDEYTVSVNNNKITVKDSAEVKKHIVAGYTNNLQSCNVTANSNIVNLEGNASVGNVFGAYAIVKGATNSTIIAECNTVNISDSVIVTAGDKNTNVRNATGIYGAYVFSSSNSGKASASANDNIVNIIGGTINADVYGAYTEAININGNIGNSVAESNNNTVNLIGGTVTGNVYGGYCLRNSIDGGGGTGTGTSNSSTIIASNNQVNISGTVNVENANLFGNNGGEGEGNTLNIKGGWEGSIGSAQNFNAINITEGANATFKTALNDANVAVNVKGATWNVDKTNTVGSASFDASSVLSIDGATFEESTGVYALNGVGELKVADGAKIVIADGKLEGVYNVAKDFVTNEGANWALQADNALWYVDWSDLDKDANTLQGKILAKSAQQMVESGVATNENKDILVEIAGSDIDEGVNPTVDAIKELTSVESNLAPEQQQKAIAAVLQVGEAGGFTGNVVSVSKQVNGSVGARNSFSGPKHGGPRHRGGHGPSVTEEANGSAIWAQYVHGKDKVDGIKMGGVENAYDSQFNGVVLGMDFKQVGSYASGIAFNYGEGDSHSKKNVVQSDSEFDFWGVSYYGAVKKQDTNFIFDIGYSESDSDVEQVVGSDTITANPEASTWTAGVKVEKLIDKGAVQIVPYAGLRFMTIDTDEYEAKGSSASEVTYYSTERQNIWLLPVGVSLSQENVYDSGWIVTPKADLSYTWAMGDTDSSMTINMPDVADPYNMGYTVMDDGSFMATVGLDAQKEDWTFGVAYSYQKGDSTRSDRWYVNARYSF